MKTKEENLKANTCVVFTLCWVHSKGLTHINYLRQC